MARADAEDGLPFVFAVTGAIPMFGAAASGRNPRQDLRPFILGELVPREAVQIVTFIGHDSSSRV
jgi:hypothetical protein